MYSGRGFREWEIGDIDVIKVGDTYHLFHLVLPNHDYIAHAVSKDCIQWKRVKNALFVGDPGEWDDDMLWTMHVTRQDDQFVMHYTGLSQEEKGHYQRIGRAVSKDLIHWEKDNSSPFPIDPNDPYESKIDNIRQWVSFRDPYLYSENDQRFLLVCARIKSGSISRRGCVGLVELTEDGHQLHDPLFVPFVYDDVECPCLVKIRGTYYLIGSIREDIKVHYWYSKQFQGEYHAYHNNVLMPKGNYAARITYDEGHLLLYSFYVSGKDVETAHRTFCPPKELDVDIHGKLVLKSFYRWGDKIKNTLEYTQFPEFKAVLNNPSGWHKKAEFFHEFACVSGYEVFCFKNPSQDFLWRGKIKIVGLGKCGLVFDANEDGDAYYISLDTVQGLVQIRRWRKKPEDIYKDYEFENLQTNNFKPSTTLDYAFELIRYGHYIELSIDGVVCLSLVDRGLDGDFIGLYSESAEVSLHESSLMELNDHREDHLTQTLA